MYLTLYLQDAEAHIFNKQLKCLKENIKICAKERFLELPFVWFSWEEAFLNLACPQKLICPKFCFLNCILFFLFKAHLQIKESQICLFEIETEMEGERKKSFGKLDICSFWWLLYINKLFWIGFVVITFWNDKVIYCDKCGKCWTSLAVLSWKIFQKLSCFCQSSARPEPAGHQAAQGKTQEKKLICTGEKIISVSLSCLQNTELGYLFRHRE